MGYYTYFTTEIEGQQPDLDKVEEDFKRITDGYSFINIEDDSRKWYYYDENMLELSKLYPSTIFHLWGEGEDRDDNWYAVYCNGQFEKVQAELVFPSIDVKSIGDIGERHPEFFI